MKRLLISLLMFVPLSACAEPLKTVFNSFTGKQDYITRIDSNTIIPGSNVTVVSNSNGTVTVASSGGGGSGGGYAVEPATVTFNLAKGVKGSTMSFTSFNTTTTSATVTGNFKSTGGSDLVGNVLAEGLFQTLGKVDAFTGFQIGSVDVLTQDSNFNLNIGKGSGCQGTGRNTCVGSGTGQSLTSGNHNLFLGDNSGINDDGTGNVIVGFHDSGNDHAGDQTCTYVGQNAGDSNINPLTDSIAIGNGAIVASSYTAQIGGILGSGHEVVLNVTSATVRTVNISSNTILPGTTFYQNGNVVMGGRVGVAINSPIVLFHIADTNPQQYISAGGTIVLGTSLIDLVTTDNSTTFIRATESQVTGNLASNPASNKAIIAFASESVVPATNSASLTNVSMRGLNANALNLGSGTVGTLLGGQYSFSNSGGGTVTNGTIYRAGSGTNTGTVTNYRYFDTTALTNAGTITNTVGYFCNTVTAGTQTNHPYCFYASDTSAWNYFGGNVGFNNTSPAAQVDIVGVTTQSYSIKVATSTASFQVAISTNGHVVTYGPSPTISSCGATPNGSVVGNDTEGAITIGGGVVTSCILTFANTWNTSPVCNVTDNSTSVNPSITAVSATSITVGLSATLGGGIVYYRCGCSGTSCI